MRVPSPAASTIARQVRSAIDSILASRALISEPKTPEKADRGGIGRHVPLRAAGFAHAFNERDIRSTCNNDRITSHAVDDCRGSPPAA